MGSAILKSPFFRMGRDIRYRSAVLCVIATLFTVACGSDESPEVQGKATSSSPTASASANPGTDYASISGLARDLKAGGIECSDLTFLKQSKTSALREFALCDPKKDPLRRLDIYLFESAKARDRWIGGIVQTGLPWLLGPNWIIVAGGEPTTAQERIELTQKAIGGQIPQVEFETEAP